MSDLISRKTLMDIFQEKADDNTGLLRNNMLFAKELVKSIPAAYDVDKVVEKLENKLNELPYITADVNIGYQNAIKEAIATVKGAVKDDDYNCNSAHADIL